MSDKPAHKFSDPAQSQTGLSAPAAEVAALRRDDFDRDVWCLMGLPVDVADIDQTVRMIEDSSRNGKRLSFITPNVNFLVRANKDQKARLELLNADLSVIDGAPLVKMAKMLGLPVTSRVAGSDVFEALRRRPSFSGRKLKVFFFGGRDGAAEQATKALNNENRGVEAVGWINPGFGDVESMSSDAIIDEINAAEPDFVMVALGAAKGQAWIERNRDRLAAPVTAHLGAVVDFTAGGIQRAPEWVQKSGLEWLWRIKEEPSLWRRYFDDGLALARIALTDLASQLTKAKNVTGEGAATVKDQDAAGKVVIHLSGDLGRHNLRPVREAFRQAATASASGNANAVILDCSSLKSVDRAFLGQLLMLEKNLTASFGVLKLAGVQRSFQSLLRANNMMYPVANDSELKILDKLPVQQIAS
ncbi:WecB/TagA/CpsF family glycosyltransferase [Hyphococcus formosus]|uniref:WecB/TagA/CpsF family glycosyltransferase n=1 Tax=Hyphococcus formosus TaxID=3143534 RepID=UPI00398AF709